MSPSAPRIVIVGNVTEDLTPECAWTAGGPALYSARAAAALGANVTLVSRVPADYDRSYFEGLTVKESRPRGAPRFENSYGGRLQRHAALQAGEPSPAVTCPLASTADAVTRRPCSIACPSSRRRGARPHRLAQGALALGIPRRPVRRASLAPSRARALQPAGRRRRVQRRGCPTGPPDAGEGISLRADPPS